MVTKKIAWLDTIRVIASLIVIISHYSYCFEGLENSALMFFLFAHVGKLGVFLFFAISGYLVNKSLERSSSIWNFYKWRLIRIVVPFVTASIVLGVLLMILGLIEPSLAVRSPLYYRDKSLETLLLFFPHDLNVTNFIGLGHEVFLGEWFIGTIIWLYLIAPLLKKCVHRAPLVSLLASIALALGTFQATLNLMETGKIVQNSWIFLVCLPEFLFGMILAVHKDFFERQRQNIVSIVATWLAVIFASFYAHYPERPLFVRFFPDDPMYLLVSIPSICLVFVFAEYLNKKFPTALAVLNRHSNVSYIAMLTQHLVIYIFVERLNLPEMHNLDWLAILFLVTLAIVLVSRFAKIFSDPLENYLLGRK